MQVAPVAVVADAKVSHIGLVVGRLLYRYGKRLRSIGTGDDTTVTKGLLYVMVVLLYMHLSALQHSDKVRNGTEVCGGKGEHFCLVIEIKMAN